MSRAKSTVPPHPFRVDPHTPADPVTGAGVCGRCHLVGRPGDSHHNMPDPQPDGPSAAARDN